MSLNYFQEMQEESKQTSELNWSGFKIWPKKAQLYSGYRDSENLSCTYLFQIDQVPKSQMESNLQGSVGGHS